MRKKNDSEIERLIQDYFAEEVAHIDVPGPSVKRRFIRQFKKPPRWENVAAAVVFAASLFIMFAPVRPEAPLARHLGTVAEKKQVGDAVQNNLYRIHRFLHDHYF